MRTAAAHGASGGQVFLRKKNNTPFLIGIVVEAKTYGKRTRTEEFKYLNETKALPISLTKDIFETEEMRKQYENRFIGENWL